MGLSISCIALFFSSISLPHIIAEYKAPAYKKSSSRLVRNYTFKAFDKALLYKYLFISISSQIIFLYVFTNRSPAYSKCTGNVFKMHPFLYRFELVFKWQIIVFA
nr:MAG TPA: hypothetical protein [Caudoviricetes sp.]